jgi:hypothetical protein
MPRYSLFPKKAIPTWLGPPRAAWGHRTTLGREPKHWLGWPLAMAQLNAAPVATLAGRQPRHGVSHPLNPAFGECDILGISSFLGYPAYPDKNDKKRPKNNPDIRTFSPRHTS